MQYVKKYWESAQKYWESKNNEPAPAPAPADGATVPVSNRIILYYNYYSYYSQKVLMALHEKQLDFEPVVVDITRGEQYCSWFLDINPRGEVPVLQEGSRIIPDSTRILDHLEKTPNDPRPLVHVSEDATVLKKVSNLRELLDAVPAGVITMGSFFHSELCGQPKLPFIHSVRNTLRSAEINNSNNLRKLAEEHPKAKSTLLYKAEIHDRKHALLANKDEYLKVLEQVDQMLSLVEKELADQPEGNWLCCESFTIADITLTILLERLYILGLEERFWANGKRPHLDTYYARVRERASYKAAVPSLAFHLKIMLSSQPPTVLGLISVASLSAVVATLYVAKKIIF